MRVARTIARQIGTLAALTVMGALLWQPPARAAGDGEEPGSRTVSEPAAASPVTPPASSDDTKESEERAPTARVPEVTAEVPASRPYRAWGVGLRGRWVSVPGWLLGLFTDHNIPLLTFGHVGIEGFRRVGNFDLAIALSYQNMSPRDGNWLGSGNDAETQTRFVQFRGLALYSADVTAIWHPMLNSWFGLHLGAGLGLAVVRGHLFLYDSAGCNSSNLDDLNACKPPELTCANGVCTSPANLPRSPSSDVPPIVPIINLVAGLDFRLPNVKGWEAKLEGGFYDAFFFGFGVAYTF
ncbi:MAG TPA: hypothetical protein VFH68_14625 [Polyangia bacterium]|jgi:hypothetical protein|nr:hypothetical protein [Polyangia bacterium]